VRGAYFAGRSISLDIRQIVQEGRVRPPIRDPLQRRRKDVLLRAEEDVIRAADALARRVGVSRNEALNAMLRAFVQDETALGAETAMLHLVSSWQLESQQQSGVRSPRPARRTRPRPCGCQKVGRRL